MAFNLDDYTTVQERSNIFWERYQDGAIRTELVEASNTRFIVVCKLYKNANDPQPFAMGHAQEVISDRGVNRDFALENAETSSRGVAFKCANIGTEKNAPSREEMEKVNRVNQEKPQSFQDKLESRQNMYGKAGSKSAQIETILRDSFEADKPAAEPVVWSVGDVVDQIAASIPNEPPACQHGHILKEGISKGGKPYYGYVCKAKACEPKWAKLTANGKWYFEGGE
jgi:hypothetical protein